jgi:hypothetical protein
MTIKEIADLCEVDQSTVWRWAESLNVDGIEDLKQGKETDLSPETAAAIIRAGGKDALAALLEENAANKNAQTAQGAPWENMNTVAVALGTMIPQLEQVIERLPRLDMLPLTPEESAEEYAKAIAERKKQMEKDGHPMLPDTKGVFTQFRCPYYGRTNISAEIEAMLGKMKEFNNEFVLAGKNIERNRHAPNPAALGPKKPFNYPISLFVADHFDFTRRESDVLLVSVAYKAYHCTAEYPVEEAAFARYLSEVYNDLAVTTKKINGVDTRVITGVRFRGEK